MKLRNYLSSELAFDCKYVGDIAIVPFRPKLAICPCIDQLSADAHSATGALHAALPRHGPRRALGDLAQIMLGTGFVLQRRRAADHFQIGDLG